MSFHAHEEIENSETSKTCDVQQLSMSALNHENLQRYVAIPDILQLVSGKKHMATRSLRGHAGFLVAAVAKHIVLRKFVE